jgi:hypothetical protein
MERKQNAYQQNGPENKLVKRSRDKAIKGKMDCKLNNKTEQKQNVEKQNGSKTKFITQSENKTLKSQME